MERNRIKIDTPDNFKINHLDKQEREANEFAMHLLIPDIAINHLIFKENVTSIKELAKVFVVSEVLIFEKLKYLKLL